MRPDGSGENRGPPHPAQAGCRGRGLRSGPPVLIAAWAAASSVCACFSVGRSVIERAIVERGPTSVAEIGAMVRAGSNCGSCVPEIKQILRTHRAVEPVR
ncbi:MAG TPA: (2Fe-2S)-binding protein [Alphaproteobacteria bacterium]|nr:(2Fe-2S)-binding protein [Alphaproteobacteria bacterium]